MRKLNKYNATYLITSLLILMIWSVLPVSVNAQTAEEADMPSPRGALLRSFVVPGWGHYYAEKDNWNRGKYHLATDVVLILTYFGLDARSSYMENNYHTLAQSKAGINLDNKSRQYKIALGSFDNLAEYNNAQLQSRNWDQVFPETAEYNWNWQKADFRRQYQDTRESVDRYRSQLPSLVALMVANRVISGISAFIHARNRIENVPQASLSYVNELGEPGVTLRVKVPF